ncbi:MULTISPECIES: hypothetical protein [unclassified Acinetobacter]|uniref:hypothetical protein n=1 Tax=unclassified Acinetobacter TaxID=196816 RepID=UPI0035B873BA
MINLSDEIKQDMYESAKNLWLSALFENISGYYPDISFDEQKALFFVLVEEALDKEIIKFDYPPLEEYSDKVGLWQTDNQTILQYLKDGFPKNASHRHDDDVNLYFYVVAPPVLWRQDDGSYYGS